MVVLDRLGERGSPARQALILAALLCAGYVLYYGSLLAMSHGFPYVMDNNETFSSLWHAANLYRFGFEGSFGLTDESYGPAAAAHPYVYTHQGNFPRLFALLLYALGARSAEAQIVVTTFTVGLASLLLAFRFLTGLTRNPGFAALACAIMFTDYVLVAQWQVVTYRVWHAFFVFSTLSCVEALRGERRRRAFALLVVNAFCLYYFELVFAAMMSAAGAIYAGLRAWRRPSIPFLAALGLGIGGGLAIATLCAQVVLYMGWDNFLADLRYTWVARNRFMNSDSALQAMRAFYESNHIVFWYNLFDGAAVRTLARFVASITFYELQIHTPVMILALLLPASAWIYSGMRWEGNASDKVGAGTSWRARLRGLLTAAIVAFPYVLVAAHLAQRFLRDRFEVAQALSLGLIAVLLAASWLAARYFKTREMRLLLPAAAVLLGVEPSILAYVAEAIAASGTLPLAPMLLVIAYVAALVVAVCMVFVAMMNSSTGTAFAAGTFCVSILMVAALVLATPLGLGWPIDRWLLTVKATRLLLPLIVALSAGLWAFRYLSRGAKEGLAARIARLRTAVEVNGLVTMILVVNAVLYHSKYQPLWETLHRYILPAAFPRFFTIVGVLLAHVVAQLVEPRREAESMAVAREVLKCALAGYAAYAVVFVLSPGYVFTGYRFRLVPLTAFFADLLIALAIYLIYRTGVAFATARSKRNAWRWGALAAAPAALYWTAVQFAYVSLMPPDQFGVLQTLAQPPYRGASFVSSTYAAPVSAYTGQWSYIDQELAQAIVERKDGQLRLRTDDRYVWLRDRSNPDYRRPEYFICMQPQSVTSLLENVRRKRGDSPGYPGCADIGLVKYAMSSEQPALPHARLVAIDKEGPRKYGFETWAIVKLDWGPR